MISFWEEGGNSDWEKTEMTYPISHPIGYHMVYSLCDDSLNSTLNDFYIFLYPFYTSEEKQVFKWGWEETCSKKTKIRDFPGGPIAKTPHSNAGDLGLIHLEGNRSYTPQLKILNASRRLKNKKPHVLPLRPGAAKELNIFLKR